jgi:hypothetical protein
MSSSYQSCGPVYQIDFWARLPLLPSLNWQWFKIQHCQKDGLQRKMTFSSQFFQQILHYSYQQLKHCKETENQGVELEVSKFA